MLLFSSESCGELLCNGIKSRLYQVMVLFQVTVDYCSYIEITVYVRLGKIQYLMFWIQYHITVYIKVSAPSG